MISDVLSFLYPNRCRACVRGEAEDGYVLCKSCITLCRHADQRCKRCGRIVCRCELVKYRGNITVGFEMDLPEQITTSDAVLADLFVASSLSKHVGKVIPFSEREEGICKAIEKRLDQRKYIKCCIIHTLSEKKEKTLHLRVQTPYVFSFFDAR